MSLPPQIIDNTNYTGVPVSGGILKLTWAASGIYYGYATIADVAYEFPNSDSLSLLTSSAVAQEIAAAAQELQNHLARIYQMPYAGTDGGILHTLRQVNAKLTTANLIERFFQGSEPNLSPAGAERRAWAELILTDIANGVIQWSSPFADAVAMGEKPLYPLSSGASILPDPNTFDPNDAVPFFTMGRNRFRSGNVM
jgi:hypothetical protein